MAGDGYGMDVLAARLGDATRTLDDIQDRMAASMRRAEHWRDEYTEHGMPGVGRGCEQIRAAAETVHAQARSLAREIGQHATTATTVTDTTEPDQVIATLTPVEHALGTLAAHCLAGTQRCTDLATLAARNLAGAKPEWLVEQATTAGTAFTHARRDLDTATTLAADAIHRARQAGTDDAATPLIPRDRETLAYTGMPEPAPEERAGAKTFNAKSDFESDAEAYRRDMVSNSGDISDLAQNVGNAVRDALAMKPPTGQNVGAPDRGLHVEPVPLAAPVGDIVTGIVAAFAMIGEGIRQAVRHSRKRKQRKDRDAEH